MRILNTNDSDHLTMDNETDECNRISSFQVNIILNKENAERSK